MNKLFLITIILILQSFPSFGEWKKIDMGDTEGIGTSFIEIDTIRKNGETFYFNTLLDFFEPKTKFGILSIVNRDIINCKTNEYKSVWRTEYKKSMGKGNSFDDYKTDDKWSKIQFNFDNQWLRLSKMLCKK
jgi:hypothetical protein